MKSLVTIVLTCATFAFPTFAADRIPMDMPAELQAVQPVKIKWGWNRVGKNPMVIDGLAITEHRRGATRSKSGDASFALPDLDWTKESTPYRFSAGPWKTQCRQSASGTRIDTRDGGDLTINSRTDLKCVFSNSIMGTEWKLDMKRSGSSLTGDAMSGEEAIFVRPATAHAARLNIPGGFVLSIDKRPIAAIELISDQIRFATDVTPQEKEIATAIAAALLLFEP